MNLFRVPNKPDQFAFDFEGPKPVSTYEPWRAQARRQYPIRFFLSETLPRKFRVRRMWREWVTEPWYYLKCLVWHRYNVIVCRDLPPTYQDHDYLLLYASFQVLVDFIELEQPEEFHMTREEILATDGYDVERADAWGRIETLYAWWQVRKNALTCDYGEDNRMLHLLILVRRYLWT